MYSRIRMGNLSGDAITELQSLGWRFCVSRKARLNASAGLQASTSNRDEAIRVIPLTHLVFVRLALVHHDLAVVGERHLEALERTRRRALEVDPGDVKSAAVTRTFELLLGRQ